MEKIKGFKNSFLVYDLFGYLVPGFFFICLFVAEHDIAHVLNYYIQKKTLVGLSRERSGFLLDYLYKYLNWSKDDTFKFTSIVISIIFCYTIGHIIAAVSSWVIEKQFNKNMLGFPSENLLLKGKKQKFFQKIFATYCRSYEDQFIDSFNEVFEKRYSPNRSNKEKYWLCFADLAKYLPSAYNRTIHFLNLYGFNRNIATSILLFLLIRITIMNWIYAIPIKTGECLIIIILFSSMLICIKNYLKLYYRQCSEVYYHFYSLHTDKNFFDLKIEDE